MLKPFENKYFKLLIQLYNKSCDSWMSCRKSPFIYISLVGTETARVFSPQLVKGWYNNVIGSSNLLFFLSWRFQNQNQLCLTLSHKWLKHSRVSRGYFEDNWSCKMLSDRLDLNTSAFAKPSSKSRNQEDQWFYAVGLRKTKHCFKNAPQKTDDRKPWTCQDFTPEESGFWIWSLSKRLSLYMTHGDRNAKDTR